MTRKIIIGVCAVGMAIFGLWLSYHSSNIRTQDIKENNDQTEEINIIEDEDSDQTETSPTIVGGDRDEHGCIGSAGYTWCEIRGKCLRTWEEKCAIVKEPIESNVSKISCEKSGGVWFFDNNVCEINSLSQSECVARGGEFNECASACRHDPKAEMCTMQCVLTCTFK
jgi:hypothetical protein